MSSDRTEKVAVLADQLARAIIDAARPDIEAELREREVAPLWEALRDSADSLHSLSEDPEHSFNVFEECEHWQCQKARAALDHALQEGSRADG